MSPPPTFAWRMVAPAAGGPGGRSRHGLAYDRNAQATILFGGIGWTDPDGRLMADTWGLRGRNWAPIATTQGPPARHRGAMAFDDARDPTVLFGGQGDVVRFLDDTWIYKDRRWRLHRDWWGRRPSGRCGHALTYDATARAIVLFGGIDPGGGPLGDTWTFRGSWRCVRGPSPPARRYAAFAYDPQLQGCVLHGGAVDDHGEELFGDTWLFRDRAWSRLPDAFTTSPRDDHALAYHQAAGALLMLGGLRSQGPLALTDSGWHPARARPPLPRHQCAPVTWDDSHGGLLLHGDETHHGGAHLDATWVLHLTGPPPAPTPG